MASQAIVQLHGKYQLDSWGNLLGLMKFRDREESRKKKKARKEAQKTTDFPIETNFRSVSSWSGRHKEIQGLVLVEDFISKSEEAALLNRFTGSSSEWEEPEEGHQPKHRRVSKYT